MDVAIWGLVIVVMLEIIAIAFFIGKLTQRVKSIETKLDNEAFRCPVHSKIEEEFIRLDERAKITQEIAIAVATAKKEQKADDAKNMGR